MQHRLSARLRRVAVWGLLLGSVCLAWGCQSHDKASNDSAESKKGVSSAQIKPRGSAPKKVKKQPQADLGKYRLAPAKRIVAIGDLHGDIAATRAVLRLAGAIDAQDQWAGGDLVVVQTGDQLDRGDSERQILDLLTKLQGQAQAQGGAVHVLLGNHETMNVAGDFRYVTAGGFKEFDDLGATMPKEVSSKLPEHARARASAFFPGGSYARQLADHPVILVVGDNVFVHGGVLPKHLKYGIAKLNKQVSDWFQGKAPAPKAILDPQSPVWTRLYSQPQVTAEACRTLNKVLAALAVKRMVVGHTIQKSISSACGDKVWRIDVGMAAHYGGSSVEALEITGSKTRILHASKP